jgi:tungstate transport system ATP-binding protein
MPEIILSGKHLLVKRSDQTVLQVDSLDITKGEVLAVIGPNGAGKSTLLLVLGRLLEPQAGTVFFRGKPIEQEDPLTYRRRIALVLQEPLLMHQSVFDNVASGLRFRGLPRFEVKRRTNEWLDRLDISPALIWGGGSTDQSGTRFRPAA